MADRLQLLPQPALPEVPGRGGTHLARRARGRPAAGRLLPRRLHAARRGRRHRLPQQGAGLRPAVQGGIGDDADDRRRSQASRRPHRHHRRAPHLGLGDDPPSARPHDRAGRRHRAGRDALDLVAPGLPAAGPRAGQAVPPTVPDPAARRCTMPGGSPSSAIGGAPRPTAGPSCATSPRSGRSAGWSMPSRPSPGRKRCSPICRATPTASRSRTAASSPSTRPASPSATRTIAATAPTGSRS